MFVMIRCRRTKLAPTEDQGVIFGIMTAPANATIDDTIRYADAAGKIFRTFPDTRFTFQITFLTADSAEWCLKPWGIRKTPTAAYLPQVQAKLAAIPGIQMFPVMPSALPGSDNFPVSFIIASTAGSGTHSRVREANSFEGDAGGMFSISAHIDTKIDQPQSEIVFDHDKVAAHRSRHAASRRRSLGQHRWQFCQSVQHRRTQLQSDSADQTDRSFESGAIGKHLRHRAEQSADSAQHGGNDSAQNGRALSQSHAAAQRCDRSAACPAGSLDTALKFLENEAHKILPKGYVLDYTGDSRQLRTEGSKFLPAFVLAVVLIFLVLAAQFNSFRDPFIILLGSVPLAMFGALLFTFLKMPFGKFFTDRLDNNVEHLLSGRSRHAGRSRVEKRNSDRAVRQRIAAARPGQTCSSRASGPHSFASDHDDERRNRRRSLSADARQRARRGRAKFNRSRARRRA